MERHIIARATQLVATTTNALQESAALRQAIDEYCSGDYNRAIDLLTNESRSKLKDARKATYNLPEQATLFDVPQVIAITTPLGDLFLSADQASGGQVEQWAREGRSHHRSQEKRFDAICQQIKDLHLDPSMNYKDQIKSIGATDE